MITLRSGAAVYPTPGAVVELAKPVTWFPPMWAFGCGVVSSGVALADRPVELVVGVALVGPLVCGTSQVVNDWFDRHVDAINQPERPIPSGRIPGRWGLHLAVAGTAVSLAVGAILGPWGFAATLLALVMAWAYSAPPVRLKRDGWAGNAAVGFTYEGLAWVTGAAVMLGGAAPSGAVLVLALLYSLGAHGIMTLNDFKSIAGDRAMGIASLPARYGPVRAAWLASVTMAVPQLVVVSLLLSWGRPAHALGVGLLLLAQLPLMRRLIASPIERATHYSATGVTLYVLGMLVSAFALRGVA